MSIYQLERDGDAEELRKLLEGSDSPAVRARAANALGEVGAADDRAIDLLSKTAIEDGDARVKAAAIDALDEIGGDALRRLFADMYDEATVDDVPVEILVEALADESPELRMAAASVVARDGVTEASAALIDRLSDPDPRVLRRVVVATGRMGDSRAVEPLSTFVGADSKTLRSDVATALGGIGGEDALTALAPLLEDPEVAVRRDAVSALGQFHQCRPIEQLVEQLGDDAEPIRRTAVYSIVDLLSNAPAQESHELRSAVVEALSTTHDGTVVDALTELFEDSSEPHRRRNAAWLLGRVSGDEALAVETLVAALDDDDETVRQFAATSLTAIESSEVEDALLTALDSTYGEGRKMILFVLGKVGSERARQRLLELMDEVDDLGVQERALAALSRLGGT